MLNMRIKHITFEGECANCGKTEERAITPKQYNLLMEGQKLIQDIFPNEEGFTPEFREFFLNSNLCNECWKALIEEEE